MVDLPRHPFIVTRGCGHRAIREREVSLDPAVEGQKDAFNIALLESTEVASLNDCRIEPAFLLLIKLFI